MEYENPVVFTAENTQECPACHAYFTKAAEDLAEKTGVELWDRDVLMEML